MNATTDIDPNVIYWKLYLRSTTQSRCVKPINGQNTQSVWCIDMIWTPIVKARLSTNTVAMATASIEGSASAEIYHHPQGLDGSRAWPQLSKKQYQLKTAQHEAPFWPPMRSHEFQGQLG